MRAVFRVTIEPLIFVVVFEMCVVNKTLHNNKQSLIPPAKEAVLWLMAGTPSIESSSLSLSHTHTSSSPQLSRLSFVIEQ